MKDHSALSRDNVLRLRDVKLRTGLGRSTIYEKLRQDGPRHDPGFPRPFPISARAIGFLESELQAWVNRKATKRGKGEIDLASIRRTAGYAAMLASAATGVW